MQGKVLVVDDEESMRGILHDILEKEGYEVLLAEGAKDAMEIIAKEKEITCAFLDLKLFGSNGIELCRAIRKSHPLTIVYAMTGWLGLFEIEECREAGFDDYFPKPLRRETIFRAVDAAKEKRDRWETVRSRI